MTISNTLYSYLTRSLIIKTTLILTLLLTGAILYLEEQPPKEYSISQISNLSLKTPIQTTGTIHPLYTSSTFSVVNIQNSTNSSDLIQAIMQTNASTFNSKNEYIIRGVVRMYEGEKQIEIYSIHE
ncbi:MAG: hypothetical protein ACLFPL_03635 [Candidatus Nanoarchaeia archaeon]